MAKKAEKRGRRASMVSFIPVGSVVVVLGSLGVLYYADVLNRLTLPRKENLAHLSEKVDQDGVISDDLCRRIFVRNQQNVSEMGREICVESGNDALPRTVVITWSRGNVNHGLHQVAIPFVAAAYACREFLIGNVDVWTVSDGAFYSDAFAVTGSTCGGIEKLRASTRATRWIACAMFIPLKDALGYTPVFHPLGDKGKSAENGTSCFREAYVLDDSAYREEPPAYLNVELFPSANERDRWVDLGIKFLAHSIEHATKVWIEYFRFRASHESHTALEELAGREGLALPLVLQDKRSSGNETRTVRVVTYAREDRVPTRRPWINGNETIEFLKSYLTEKFPEIDVQVIHLRDWPQSFLAQAYAASQADVLFMPHGAANSNSFFLRPSSVFVEISDRCRPLSCLCNTLWAGWTSRKIGFNRSIVECEAQNENGTFSLQHDFLNLPFRVNVSQVAVALGLAVDQFLSNPSLRA